MRQFFRTHQRFTIGALCWLALFGIFSVTAWQQLAWPTFSSPDETANYAFAQQVRETGVAAMPTTLPGSPRSVLNTGTHLVPGSFVFFPSFLGTVGKLTGTFGMLMFGPALAATAILAWWFFLRRHYGSTCAWVASAVLATVPTFWFYSSRGLWQNGVFTCVLMLSVALSALAWQKRWWPLSVFTGISWGIAFAIRPSEAPWLVPGIIVATALVWRSIPWKHVAIAVACAALFIPLTFALQRQTYGSVTGSGYRPEGIFIPSKTTESSSWIQRTVNAFFPFGTNPWRALQRFATHSQPIGAVTILGFGGVLFVLFRRSTSQATRAVVTGSLVSAALLIVLYGNYTFVEYPVSRVPTLGISYLRYWLPLVPLFAFGIGALAQWLQTFRRFGLAVALVGTGLVVGLNVHPLLTSDVGPRSTIPQFQRQQAESRWIVANTPMNAIVVGNDKATFPRRHAVGVNAATLLPVDTIQSYAKLAPVYIYLGSVGAASAAEATYASLQHSELIQGPNNATLMPFPQTP
jgi:4-amino-4-deoxy-L-arabinose transferase-like glycosyltransferase